MIVITGLSLYPRLAYTFVSLFQNQGHEYIEDLSRAFKGASVTHAVVTWVKTLVK